MSDPDDDDDDLPTALGKHPPFAQMRPEHRALFAAAARRVRLAVGDTVLAPAHGPVQQLGWLCSGSITGQRPAAAGGGAFSIEAGELFPVAALLGRRAVTSTYTADEPGLCLQVPAATVQQLAALSPPFAGFLHSRHGHLLELARLARPQAQPGAAELPLDVALADLPRRTPLAVRGDTPLRQALTLMQAHGVGSVLVTGDTAEGDHGDPVTGILTRHDVLDRITLPGLALDTPVAGAMSSPVHTLSTRHTAQDAALLMARHGIRHVPVTEQGRLVSIVSERDLFAWQRLSLVHIGQGIRTARDVPALRQCAADIRAHARQLHAQGLHARPLTELVSRLNDQLTERLVRLFAARHGLDLQRACWLAFGSEGRSEQTLATDQDNGLVFDSPDPQRDRPAWLAFARDVNQALDDCGYPLCKGGVMAGEADCCLSPHEWAARFDRWMAHGAPVDLLHASIFFDVRALAGRTELATPLRARIVAGAARQPRFIKQMADNGLRLHVALNWRGAIDTQRIDGHEVVDLKLGGTAVFVDVARLMALAHGIDATGTRARLEAAGARLQVPAHESEAWVAAFEVLQRLRLQVQMSDTPALAAHPNRVAVDLLNDLDRRMLRESLRVARRLQQRLELDYQR